MIKKLAIIRDNKDEKCPFSLSIPFACKNAGSLVEKMAPISMVGEDADKEDIENLAKANNRILIMEANKEPCKYNDKIFEDKLKCECNFDSTVSGVKESPLAASPFYSRVYDNVALDGLYNLPIGGDMNISRNLYYAVQSLQGENKEDKEKIKK